MGLLNWKREKKEEKPDKSEAIQMIQDWAHKLNEAAQDLEANLEKAQEAQGLPKDQSQ